MEFSKSTLTIIVPIFNEEIVIEKFVTQLLPIISDLELKQNCQVLFVNNGSTDRSLEILRGLEGRVKNFGILTLARNFGYETALIAGLSHVESDYYALCDGDGEDPVELIRDFQKSVIAGSEIAIGIRRNRIESKVTKTFRNFSYLILSRLGDDPFRKNAGNFSMFTKVVRNAILAENNSYPFLRSTLSRTGYKLEEFPHNRNPRIDGKSKYRKISLLKFAIAGFMTTTTWPLRFISYIGTANLLLLIPFFVLEIFGHGQFLLLNILLLIGTEITFFAGVVALYLARIYKNSLGRPLFYVAWRESIEVGQMKLTGRN